jgi:Holliday junction DNA helicase RuvB
MSSFVAPVLNEEEEEVELTLRPRRLDDFVGQERVKEQLEIALAAARARGEALDHVLLAGPPGLGKTSLAYIIREELGVGLRTIAGPAIEKRDIAAILTSLAPRDVLFVDEIHRLSRTARDPLPGARGLPHRHRHGRGAAAQNLTLDLAPFTLVERNDADGPADDAAAHRFGLTFRLDYYDPDQLGAIVHRSRTSSASTSRPSQRGGDRAPLARHTASRTGSSGASAISHRSTTRARSRPRNRTGGAQAARIDEQGLDRGRASCLRSIAVKFDGGPVGLRRSPRRSARSRDDRGRLRAVPPAARLHQRTPRGHTILKLGRAHVGVATCGPTPTGGIWTPIAEGRTRPSSRQLLRAIASFAQAHGVETPVGRARARRTPPASVLGRSSRSRASAW